RVTDDLGIARVYVRLLDTDSNQKQRTAALTAMERARSFLRRELGTRLRLRRVPELQFHWDDVIDEAARVDALLADVRGDVASQDLGLNHALHLVREGNRFLVTCHRRPDADALGSALGLSEVLRYLGKTVTVWMPERLPKPVRFLAQEGAIVESLPPGVRFDGTFVTDTASPALLPEGYPDPAVAGPTVVIDHHAFFDDFGDFVIRDAQACATAEVVIAFAQALGVAPLPSAANEPLYAAIVADTGGFRYASTTANVMRLCADMVDSGVEPWKVASQLFECWSMSKMRLVAMMLNTLETHLNGTLATLCVDRVMLETTHAEDFEVDGLVNYARFLEGVEVAALAWEAADGRVRISLRSAGEVDVAAIASKLGGGGHRTAAGLTTDEDLPSSLDWVRREVATVLRAQT
ncbi:MAG: 30S ribosome-binding factor RbfA, partial [Myxococcota bacterium]